MRDLMFSARPTQSKQCAAYISIAVIICYCIDRQLLLLHTVRPRIRSLQRLQRASSRLSRNLAQTLVGLLESPLPGDHSIEEANHGELGPKYMPRNYIQAFVLFFIDPLGMLLASHCFKRFCCRPYSAGAASRHDQLTRA